MSNDIDENRTYFGELEPGTRRRDAGYAYVIALIHPTQKADTVRVHYDVKRKLWVMDAHRGDGTWVESATVPGKVP